LSANPKVIKRHLSSFKNPALVNEGSSEDDAEFSSDESSLSDGAIKKDKEGEKMTSNEWLDKWIQKKQI